MEDNDFELPLHEPGQLGGTTLLLLCSVFNTDYTVLLLGTKDPSSRMVYEYQVLVRNPFHLYCGSSTRTSWSMAAVRICREEVPTVVGKTLALGQNADLCAEAGGRTTGPLEHYDLMAPARRGSLS
jgi:hypothetical protein